MTSEGYTNGTDLKELLPIIPSQRIDKDMASPKIVRISIIGGLVR